MTTPPVVPPVEMLGGVAQSARMTAKVGDLQDIANLADLEDLRGLTEVANLDDAPQVVDALNDMVKNIDQVGERADDVALLDQLRNVGVVSNVTRPMSYTPTATEFDQLKRSDLVGGWQSLGDQLRETANDDMRKVAEDLDEAAESVRTGADPRPQLQRRIEIMEAQSVAEGIDLSGEIAILRNAIAQYTDELAALRRATDPVGDLGAVEDIANGTSTQIDPDDLLAPPAGTDSYTDWVRQFHGAPSKMSDVDNALDEFRRAKGLPTDFDFDEAFTVMETKSRAYRNANSFSAYVTLARAGEEVTALTDVFTPALVQGGASAEDLQGASAAQRRAMLVSQIAEARAAGNLERTLELESLLVSFDFAAKAIMESAQTAADSLVASMDAVKLPDELDSVALADSLQAQLDALQAETPALEKARKSLPANERARVSALRIQRATMYQTAITMLRNGEDPRPYLQNQLDFAKFKGASGAGDWPGYANDIDEVIAGILRNIEDGVQRQGLRLDDLSPLENLLSVSRANPDEGLTTAPFPEVEDIWNKYFGRNVTPAGQANPETFYAPVGVSEQMVLQHLEDLTAVNPNAVVQDNLGTAANVRAAGEGVGAADPRVASKWQWDPSAFKPLQRPAATLGDEVNRVALIDQLTDLRKGLADVLAEGDSGDYALTIAQRRMLEDQIALYDQAITAIRAGQNPLAAMDHAVNMARFGESLSDARYAEEIGGTKYSGKAQALQEIRNTVSTRLTDAGWRGASGFEDAVEPRYETLSETQRSQIAARYEVAPGDYLSAPTESVKGLEEPLTVGKESGGLTGLTDEYQRIADAHEGFESIYDQIDDAADAASALPESIYDETVNPYRRLGDAHESFEIIYDKIDDVADSATELPESIYDETVGTRRTEAPNDPVQYDAPIVNQRTRPDPNQAGQSYDVLKRAPVEDLEESTGYDELNRVTPNTPESNSEYSALNGAAPTQPDPGPPNEYSTAQWDTMLDQLDTRAKGVDDSDYDDIVIVSTYDDIVRQASDYQLVTTAQDGTEALTESLRRNSSAAEYEGVTDASGKVVMTESFRRASKPTVRKAGVFQRGWSRIKVLAGNAASIPGALMDAVSKKLTMRRAADTQRKAVQVTNTIYESADNARSLYAVTPVADIFARSPADEAFSSVARSAGDVHYYEDADKGALASKLQDVVTNGEYMEIGERPHWTTMQVAADINVDDFLNRTPSNTGGSRASSPAPTPKTVTTKTFAFDPSDTRKVGTLEQYGLFVDAATFDAVKNGDLQLEVVVPDGLFTDVPTNKLVITEDNWEDLPIMIVPDRGRFKSLFPKELWEAQRARNAQHGF